MKQFLMGGAGLAVVMGAVIGAGPASAAVTQYTDRAAFEAAAGAVSVETFNAFSDQTLWPSTDLGAFTVDTNSEAYLLELPGGFWSVNDTRYLHANIYGSVDTPGRITFTFDTAITAFGADFNSLNNGEPRTYAVVGGTTFDPLPLAPGFLGFVSDTAFTTVSFYNPQFGQHEDTFGLDNLTTATGGAVPEPATWALMVGGFGLAGAAVRRRRMALAYARRRRASGE